LAKIVLVCLRNPTPQESARMQRRLRRFLAELCPDNLTPASPVLSSDGRGLFLAVFNPADPAASRDCSAYVGWLASSQHTWSAVGSAAPVGSYALFRSNSAVVELLADYAASRTIWIGQDDEVFVASTSQRAIPHFLGSYQPNPAAQAWMLSCGTLGPSQGWDRRARALGPAGTARFDRLRWQLSIREPEVEFKIDQSPDDVHARRLAEALETVVGNLKLDLSQWVLPLSGGFDSRAILMLMKHRDGLRAVTWGRAEALRQKGNDAYVARQVAKRFGIEHSYFPTDLSQEPVDRLLNRYLVAGDGRTDGVLAYMDGFETWRKFHESGIRGVIRGDHGFGPGPCPPLRDHLHAMHFDSMMRWCDHGGLPSFASFGMPEFDEQILPQSFEPAFGESPEDLRDRLYQLYRVPVYHAGQSDLKSAYVEISSPFFAKPILELTRTHPEHLRNGKTLFRNVVRPRDVPVPYALDAAIVPPRKLLADERLRELVCDECGSRRARDVFTREFTDFLLAAWADRSAGTGRDSHLATMRRYLRLWIPAALRSRMRSEAKRKQFDLRWVGLRAYIVIRMQQRLAADSGSADADSRIERRLEIAEAM
jgi:hypothetical protein